MIVLLQGPYPTPSQVIRKPIINFSGLWAWLKAFGASSPLWKCLPASGDLSKV